MWWTYKQSTGTFIFEETQILGGCYSGKGEGKNNPAMQNVKYVGPLPCGKYTMGQPFVSRVHGPFAIPLTPDPSNEMFGRSEFLIHGDSLEHPGEASEGCIVALPRVRQILWNSGVRDLLVIP